MSVIFYNNYSSFLKKRFGCEVVKIPLNINATCPNRDGKLSYDGCTYCSNEGSGTGNTNSAKEQAESFIMKKGRSERAFIAYFQSYTNMYGDPERIIDEIESVADMKGVVGISVATRPDETSPAILSKLNDMSKSKFIQIEIGLESANNTTLERINRHHTAEDFKTAAERIRESVQNAHLTAHIIIGLPNETLSDYIRTVELVNESEADGIKFHHLYIHRNSQMKKEFDRGETNLLWEDEYIDLLLILLERLESRIVVHRTKSSLEGENLTAPLWTLDRHFYEKLILRAGEKQSYQGKYHGDNHFNCW